MNIEKRIKNIAEREGIDESALRFGSLGQALENREYTIDERYDRNHELTKIIVRFAICNEAGKELEKASRIVYERKG